jgi:hypothetical protein
MVQYHRPYALHHNQVVQPLQHIVTVQVIAAKSLTRSAPVINELELTPAVTIECTSPGSLLTVY